MPQAAIPSETRPPSHERRRILVRGAVQGVGFRPFIYREATARGLAGWVGNTTEGVIVEVEGTPAAVAGLLAAIREAPPANARIAALTVRPVAPQGTACFKIQESRDSGIRSAHLLPDLATCDDCLAEMLDPTDRRYRYPFINCTQCGPRYSIIEDIPYDRDRTSMHRFKMCDDCQAEYDDPANRRFHAEPNACPSCGPRLALWTAAGTVTARDDAALNAAAAALRDGQIVAAKGIGGFHLMADARNETVVRRLRDRKRREEKPFAVMMPTLADVRANCRLDAAAENLLTGTARPIVLLRRISGPIAPSVAPDNARLGVLLPYAPLHYLLMRELGFPIVATSGNVTDEPIATDEGEALRRLAGLADHFLVHDRPIVRPLDDSVAQIVCGQPQLLRRARGYAPAPVATGTYVDGILAVGGHLKATVALTTDAGVMLSQHLGDLETLAARRTHERAREDLTRMYGIQPRLVVRDLHPDYASSRMADDAGLPVVAVQHHLAHVVAGLAENELGPPALGVAWDGTGYGTDGTVWGGEFLLVTKSGWDRVARLRPFSLPGGEAAAREPRRAALGLLHAGYGNDAFAMTDLAPVAAFTAQEREVLCTMLTRGVNAPQTSSMGRLFDAVAALCGLRQCAGYEGQAAAALELAAEEGAEEDRYDLPLREAVGHGPALFLDWRPALDATLADLRASVNIATVSRRWHSGLAAAVVAVATHIGERRVVLTGGCFQNTRLTVATVTALTRAGFDPVWHRRVPPNDGGIAFGQAIWAAWMEQQGETPCA